MDKGVIKRLVVKVVLFFLWLWAYITVMIGKLIRLIYKERRVVNLTTHIVLPEGKIFWLESEEILNLLSTPKFNPRKFTLSELSTAMSIFNPNYYVLFTLIIDKEQYMMMYTPGDTIKYPLQDEDIPKEMSEMFAIDAEVTTENNISQDITSLINAYAGPNGDFYWTIYGIQTPKEEWINNRLKKVIDVLKYTLHIKSISIVTYNYGEISIPNL